jgi:hypothetical protein
LQKQNPNIKNFNGNQNVRRQNDSVGDAMNKGVFWRSCSGKKDPRLPDFKTGVLELALSWSKLSAFELN